MSFIHSEVKALTFSFQNFRQNEKRKLLEAMFLNVIITVLQRPQSLPSWQRFGGS